MQKSKLPEATAKKLPRWRGFNLQEMFHEEWANKPFNEVDFEWIAELGFNFVRLPMDYRIWTEKSDWTKFKEPALKEVDKAVQYGEKHGIHVQLNFHRGPGFTVNSPKETKSLWDDEETQRVFALHWVHFAKRYKGKTNAQISFNLLNEPADVDAERHKKAMARAIEAVHEADPKRLIICDGRDYGNTPAEELIGLPVAQATRGYGPFQLTHYKASWVNGSDTWNVPDYPTEQWGERWDKKLMWEKQFKHWKELEKKGAGVMVGEFGAFNQTPHKVVMRWMKDLLDMWKEQGWGWALWGFRGGFGFIDSERADVKYEDWKGHKLDREMLKLLQQG
ncbi:MAG: cellulase family glycosylhydrolase [Fimbriimonadia bacterium]|nr:cellulase family glycosylhydrolase [Fimbriimonadia bacterium]